MTTDAFLGFGCPFETAFLGELTSKQKAATKALLEYETGVLAATTAFGKTFVAASIIAARKTNTLILIQYHLETAEMLEN